MKDILVGNNESKEVMDNTDVEFTNYSIEEDMEDEEIEAMDKRHKSFYCMQFNESLNSTYIYFQLFVKWWRLPKRGPKIRVDDRCPRCGGAR